MPANPITKGLKKILSFLGRILYTSPKRYYIKIKRRGVKKFIKQDLLGSTDPPKKKAFSIILGVFIGLVPLYGFQTLLVLLLSSYFKLNKVVALAFSYISIPPLLPFIMYLEFKAGQWILNNYEGTSLYTQEGKLNLAENLGTYLAGSVSLALVASVVLGVAGYFLFSYFQKNEVVNEKPLELKGYES